jgi:fatty-acyl-CoA synthase
MNLSRIVERWSRQLPGKVALHFHGSDLRYAELWDRIVSATQALAARGVAKGDRVAFLGYNHPDMLVLLFALSRLGAILVPLNWRLAAAEHRVIVADCDPRLLVCEAEFSSTARALGVPLLVLGANWEAAGSAAVDGADSDDLLVVYTSGTTGKPKGAVLTQSALMWNALNGIHAHDLSQADHVLSPLPLFHVGGLNNQTLPALLAGATVTLHRRFEPGLWLADVAARRPTVSILVPATLQAVIAHPDWARTDLSSLKMMNTGSMVVPDSLIRAFHARGIPVGQIYGSTETAPIAAVLLKEDAMSQVGSAGKAALHCEVKIVAGEDGAEAAPGVVGEIWVRGPNVMRCYWNDPEATQAAFHEGWFKTGDLARRDENGFLRVAGRSKELIISGGENIYPAELENVLADCSDIAEHAVIGIEDPKWGEAACACIVRKPGAALDETRVLALFQDRLARFKHPRRVVFLDALPKNALGKVQKPELKKALAA